MKQIKIDTKKMTDEYIKVARRMPFADKKVMFEHVEFLCSGKTSVLTPTCKLNFNTVGEMPLVNEPDEMIIKDLFFYIAISKTSSAFTGNIDFIKMMFREIEKRGHIFCA